MTTDTSVSAASASSNLIPMSERDVLEQDSEIRGQKYFLASFISPEDMIADTKVFIFSKFLNNFSQEMSSLLDKLSEWAVVNGAQKETVSDTMNSIKTKYNYVFSDEALQEEYKMFLSKNETDLSNQYSQEHEFKTNIRGLKVRGVFGSIEEAKHYSSVLQNKYPKHPPTFTGEVGCWAPWSPKEDDIDDVQYMGDQLNTMMSKYNDKNEKYEKEFLDRLCKEQKQKQEQEQEAEPTKPEPAVVELET